DMALPAQLLEQLHAVHARHLYVEHGQVHPLRAHAAQRLGAVAVAAHGEALGLEGNRDRSQDVAVVIDKSNSVCHFDAPPVNLAAMRIGHRAAAVAIKYGHLLAKTNPARRFLLHDNRLSFRSIGASLAVFDAALPPPLPVPHEQCRMSKTASRDPARFARLMARRGDRGALASSLRGMPYASLVTVAADFDASPLLLLSDLAQ